MRIAEQMLGRAPDRIEPFEPRVGGDDSHSFRLWCDGEAMLLKVKKDPDSPIGVYFHRRAREAGVPTPALVGFEPVAGPCEEACAIWEWIEGVPAEWSEGEPCPYDEAELGRLLRLLHELRCELPYGMLGDDPPARHFRSHPALGPVSDTWSGFFHCDRAARRYRDMGYLSSGEADTLASLPDRLAERLDAAEPRLLHMGDVMFQGNVLVDPDSGTIRAVVDYVESTAGDPRWELAWFDYYFTQYPCEKLEFDMPRFRRAYGTDHDPDDDLGRFYLLAILAFEKLLFFDPASPRGRWATGKLKEILAHFSTH
jgi:aminoglycoside phosphotransferase (APT) family kinase protein